MLCIAVALAVTGGKLQASEYHVNPDSVPAVFSGSALLRYYSEALDYVIQIQPDIIREYMDALPFAEIPDDTRPKADEFSRVTVNLAFSVEEAYTLWDVRSGLLDQGLLGEALEMDPVIGGAIELALIETGALERSNSELGTVLGVGSSSSDSELKLAYEEVGQKIKRLRDMLEVLKQVFEQSHSSDIETQQRLIPVTLALQISSESAFVGESVRFEASVLAAGDGLAGRELKILLNGLVVTQVSTDAAGRCSGEFQIPYWYVPAIEVRAYYQSGGTDSGVYMAALSPAVNFNVLYYPVAMELDLTSPAHPGLTANGILHLDYGDHPSLDNRTINIHLDDQPIIQFKVRTESPFSFALDPALRPGVHTLGVTIPADGRYAPASGFWALEVTMEVPSLDVTPSGIFWIPGAGEISGRLTSALGPLAGASITLDGVAGTKTFTDSQGRFSIAVNFGMDLTFLGERKLQFGVNPAEPWHESINAQVQVFTLNYVNTSLVIAFVVLAAIILPRYLVRRFHIASRALPRPAPVSGLPGIAGLSFSKININRSASTVQAGTPRWTIYTLYRQALRLLVRLGVRLPVSHQTMREYAYDAFPVPVALRKILINFTRLVEQYYYGPDSPAQTDVERSHAFMGQVEHEVEG